MTALDAASRSQLLRRAMTLELVTLGWNVVEGGVGVAAALSAGSIALLGFGVDSFVESGSAAVMIWRLRAERRGVDEQTIEALDQRASKLIAGSLFALGAYVAIDSVRALWTSERPSPSLVGLVLLAVSLRLPGHIISDARPVFGLPMT